MVQVVASETLQPTTTELHKNLSTTQLNTCYFAASTCNFATTTCWFATTACWFTTTTCIFTYISLVSRFDCCAGSLDSLLPYNPPRLYLYNISLNNFQILNLNGITTTSSHLTLVTCIALVVALYRTTETLNTPSYEITVIPSFASFTSLELSARS